MTGGAEELEQPAREHHLARPRNVRRDDAHLHVGGHEMRDAADEEPQKNESKAGAPAPRAPGHSRYW